MKINKPVNISDSQRRKLLAAAEVVEGGDMAVLKKIIEFQEFLEKYELDDSKLEEAGTLVADLRTYCEANFAKIDEIPNQLKEITYIIDELESNLKEKINLSEKDVLAQIRGLSQKLYSEIKSIRQSIPKATDLSDYEQKLKEIESKIPVIKEQIVETPEEIKNKLVTIKEPWLDKSRVIGLEDLERIPDLERIIRNNVALPVTTSFFNGLRAKNLNIVGGTAVRNGDTIEVTLPSTGGGHTIQDEGTDLTQRTNLNFVGAGVTVTDDSANDATKVTISTSAGAGFQAPTGGAVDGTNAEFTFAVEPNAVVVDGVMLRKVASDSTVNWMGTTTITLSVAPNFDIFGVC